MESQSETTQTVSALKLPVLKTGEYDLWSMRMEQYLTFTDHALWEVIVNGDSVSPVASASTGAEGPIPPKTAEQKLARKNELKAKSTLMLAIPDEHLLKFHACKDAKSLWEAIKNRFGGNKESKKMQKTILKQNYKNFAASSQEGLDKTYDRFQKLISQLEIHGEVISQEDANLKLLRSLPSAWNNIALIMRNKSDLDTLSMDDLYNNLKVTNETVNTAHSVSAASSKDQAYTTSYADDVMFSFFANQYNASQLDYEDLEQIDADDLEEMDLKWQVAMLTMRVKRFIKKVKKLEKKLRARTSRMKLFKIGTSKRKSLDEEYVSKQGRKSDKTKPMFDDSDFAELDVDNAMENVEGDAETQGRNTAKQITTNRDTVNIASIDVSVAGPSNVSTVDPSTSTVGDIFKDERMTIADTLVAIRSTRPRTTLVVIRDVEEEPRRAILLPTLQSQDKEITQRLHEEEKAKLERMQRERAAQEEASNAALITEFDYVQARMEVDALLAARL
ncbi:hypothetical protein Tco_0150335 [Tanacetum coccineum]